MKISSIEIALRPISILLLALFVAFALPVSHAQDRHLEFTDKPSDPTQITVDDPPNPDDELCDDESGDDTDGHSCLITMANAEIDEDMSILDLEGEFCVNPVVSIGREGGTNVPEFPGIGLIVSDPAVVVTNITFQNYDSESAVHVLFGGLEITHCRILSNDGDSYSGIDVNAGQVDITDCEFVDNNVAVRAGKSSHVRFFDDSGSSFTNNAVGLLAQENSSIKMWADPPHCNMTNSPMMAKDHSTVRGYSRCTRDAASTCTIDDPSARCVEY